MFALTSPQNLAPLRSSKQTNATSIAQPKHVVLLKGLGYMFAFHCENPLLWRRGKLRLKHSIACDGTNAVWQALIHETKATHEVIPRWCI